MAAAPEVLFGELMGAEMTLVETFHKRAADCEQMAKQTRDSDSKAAWQELARRFQQIAEQSSLSPPYTAPRRFAKYNQSAGRS
jgi:hypothetical protein